jgi:hypothetical protein
MNRDLVPLIEWGVGALVVLIALMAHKKVLRLFGLHRAGDSVAIVTKFVLFAPTRPSRLSGSCAPGRGRHQADTLAPG